MTKPAQVVFRSLPEGDESRDELMETVTTDESVVKEYNPYREAELMGACCVCVCVCDPPGVLSAGLCVRVCYGGVVWLFVLW